MPRAKGGYKTRRRRKNILALAKGFRGRRRTVYNIARPTVERALFYAYRDILMKKRYMIILLINRLYAAAKLNNTSYSKLMGNLKKAGIDLNRKVLSEMAINAPEAFAELVKSVTK